MGSIVSTSPAYLRKLRSLAKKGLGVRPVDLKLVDNVLSISINKNDYLAILKEASVIVQEEVKKEQEQRSKEKADAERRKQLEKVKQEMKAVKFSTVRQPKYESYVNSILKANKKLRIRISKDSSLGAILEMGTAIALRDSKSTYMHKYSRYGTQSWNIDHNKPDVVTHSLKTFIEVRPVGTSFQIYKWVVK